MKILAALSALALALGMVAFTSVTASAHTSSLTASTATCDTATGNYDVIYTLVWGKAPANLTGAITSKSQGSNWISRGDASGISGSVQWTGQVPGDTVGNGPMEYSSIKWPAPDNFNATSQAQAQGLKGDCAIPATAGVSFSTPTCDTAQTISLNTPTNAVWGAIKYGVDGSSGNQTYDVTAMATGKSKFADGTTAQQFHGTLLPATGNCPPGLAVAIYIYPLIDSSKPASWDNSGKQTEIAHRLASSTSDWYADLPTLPSYVCGTGWGVQQDIAQLSSTFTVDSFPAIVDHWNKIGILSWPPLLAAKHQSLSALVSSIPACAAPAAPTPAPASETCDSSNGQVSTIPGTVTFPAGDWTWTDSSKNLVSGKKSYVDGTYIFTAHAISGYQFDSKGTVTLDFTVIVPLTKNTGPCKILINPVQPKTTSSDVCGTANDTLTVDSSAVGVVYSVAWNNAHTVATVTAAVSDGNKYYFAQGATTSWVYNFTDNACPVQVTPVQPKTTSSDVCGTANDTLTVDSSAVGVVYSVAWNNAHTVATVTAAVSDGNKYYFAQGATTSWVYNFTDNACPVEVIPVKPNTTSSDVCGTANDTLTVDSSAVGVVYSVTWSKDHLTATVTAAVSDANMYFFAKGTTTSWDYTFTDTACLKVQPLDPKAVDPTCPNVPNPHGGYILLDLKSGLHYSIDGVSTSTAQNAVAPGTHAISVTVDSAYELVGPASWTLKVATPFCPPTDALYTPAASMKNLTCSGGGSYTLGDTQSAFKWFVNGSKVATSVGTYSVKDATSVNVEAVLNDSVNDGWEQGAKTAWTFTFTYAPDCLPTLAFTGSSGGTAGLLLAGGFLIIGGAIIAFERRFRPSAK